MDYLPKRLPNLLIWYANFAAKIADYETTLEIPEAELEQALKDYQTLCVMVQGNQARQTDT